MKCARTICTNAEKGYVHEVDKRRYCADCANLLNYWSFKDHGLIIVKQESQIPDEETNKTNLGESPSNSGVDVTIQRGSYKGIDATVREARVFTPPPVATPSDKTPPAACAGKSLEEIQREGRRQYIEAHREEYAFLGKEARDGKRHHARIEAFNKRVDEAGLQAVASASAGEKDETIAYLRSLLEECGNTFAWYASLHRNKGTPEGVTKAYENQKMADRIQQTLKKGEE